jgi:hypothetical protein
LLVFSFQFSVFGFEASDLSFRISDLAAANKIGIVFLDIFGGRIARVWAPRMGSTAAIRRQQFDATARPSWGVDRALGPGDRIA